MTLVLNIDRETEKALEEAFGQDLGRATVEALAAEGYRSGRLGVSTVRRLLGLETRWDVEAWLASRQIPLNYKLDDFEADCRTLDQLERGRTA
jgi:hypothetical protein